MGLNASANRIDRAHQAGDGPGVARALGTNGNRSARVADPPVDEGGMRSGLP